MNHTFAAIRYVVSLQTPAFGNGDRKLKKEKSFSCHQKPLMRVFDQVDGIYVERMKWKRIFNFNGVPTFFPPASTVPGWPISFVVAFKE